MSDYEGEIDESDDRYVDEFGQRLPKWKPQEPFKRGLHKSFAAAAEAAVKDLLTPHDPFYEALVDNWKILFPKLPARPGRFDAGKIFLYVPNAPTMFSLRPQLPKFRKLLAALPNAPKKIDLRLEIHK